MRKVALIALCLLVMGSTAFALDLVIGAGGLFGFCVEEYNYPRTETFYAYKQINDATTYGGYVFFGISRFMEGSIYVMPGENSRVDKWYDEDEGKYVEEPWEDKDNSYQVGVSLYVKYPFTLTQSLVIFPTGGLDLQNNNSGLDLWFRGGIGFDIFLSQRIFLRGQAFYGIGVMSIYKMGDSNVYTAAPSHGPLFKLGFGWMY